MNVLEELRHRFALTVLPEIEPSEFASSVRAATDPKFGDYQANGCMALGKKLKRPPREIASEIAKVVDLEPIAGPLEIAGPGFLNIQLRDEWISSTLRETLTRGDQGIEPPERRLTIVIDYSSPNVAKPMHVGHIRSSVIGDSLARIYRALGHHVIRDNHLGDWGTQFGLILWAWKHHRDELAYECDSVQELARLYRLANDLAKGKESGNEVADAARLETAKLHAGDRENRSLWEQFMPHCLKALQSIYDRLGITFDFQLGESYYDFMLPEVVQELEAKGLATQSEGATVVFPDDHPSQTLVDAASNQSFGEGKPPFMVRKRDGAYTYATTDLATIKHRVNNWNPDEILYVVDHRQSEHFRMLFEVAQRWGYQAVHLEHVAFGTILGPDRRPFKTREGDVVGLESLLEESVAEARRVVDEQSRDLSEQERIEVAKIVGLGAIKYADLCQNRSSDYVFDWKKMMAMNGNTATYLQYAYARCANIFRKGGVAFDAFDSAPPEVLLSQPSERALAVQVLRFSEALASAAADRKPNILTDYLFELANRLSVFYDECPVLKAESLERKNSRLVLVRSIATTLARGLDLLGIQVVERM